MYSIEISLKKFSQEAFEYRLCMTQELFHCGRYNQWVTLLDRQGHRERICKKNEEEKDSRAIWIYVRKK